MLLSIIIATLLILTADISTFDDISTRHSCEKYLLALEKSRATATHRDANKHKLFRMLVRLVWTLRYR